MKIVYAAIFVVAMPVFVFGKDCGGNLAIKIQKGNTISAFANIFGISEADIRKLNYELKSDQLIPGEDLCLPLPSSNYAERLETENTDLNREKNIWLDEKQKLNDRIKYLEKWTYRQNVGILILLPWTLYSFGQFLGFARRNIIGVKTARRRSKISRYINLDWFANFFRR
ncbi:LysM peptidoglycan-binding domain-containing protein [Candidatus Giovannonibacteria bacterium]|nr:LysM peptidoglycan-binding domain-containing protein [Candidatus Giovannonibacteria bacterium]